MAGQNKEGAESMKRYKIMIIEDDPVIQGELQTLLNGNGYATIGIKDFSAVIEQIQDETPHLILLDIMTLSTPRSRRCPRSLAPPSASSLGHNPYKGTV